MEDKGVIYVIYRYVIFSKLMYYLTVFMGFF